MIATVVGILLAVTVIVTVVIGFVVTAPRDTPPLVDITRCDQTQAGVVTVSFLVTNTGTYAEDYTVTFHIRTPGGMRLGRTVSHVQDVPGGETVAQRASAFIGDTTTQVECVQVAA